MKLIGTRASSKPLYAALGLPDNATAAEIRASFLCISRAQHPDVNAGGTEAFLLAKRAFEVLTDPGKRRLYDLYEYDSESAESMKSAAIQNISNAMVQILSTTAGSSVNLLMKLREFLSGEISRITQEMRKISTVVQNIEARLLEIEDRWSGAEALRETMLSIIRVQLVVTRAEAANMQNNILVLQTSLMLLEDARYRMPVALYQTMPGNSAWNTGASFVFTQF